MQKVIEKVRALLSKTTDAGASEAEAASAFAMAQRLMAENHLQEADLAHGPQDDYAKVDGAAFDRHTSWVGSKIYRWESDLCGFVSEFIGVPRFSRPYLQTIRERGLAQFDESGNPKRGKSFVFYGVSEDAAMAKELYDELRMLIAAMATAKHGSIYRGDGAAYAEGFVMGLYSKLHDATEAAKTEAKKLHSEGSSTALVLIERRTDLVRYKQTKAKDWLKKECGINLSAGSRRYGSSGSGNARSEGVRDGAAADVSRVRTRKIGAS